MSDIMFKYVKSAYRQGADAFDSGDTVCPFSAGTEQAEAWRDGWCDAQDFDNKFYEDDYD